MPHSKVHGLGAMRLAVYGWSYKPQGFILLIKGDDCRLIVEQTRYTFCSLAVKSNELEGVQRLGNTGQGSPLDDGLPTLQALWTFLSCTQGLQ